MIPKEELQMLIDNAFMPSFLDWIFDVEAFLNHEKAWTLDMQNNMTSAKFYKNDRLGHGSSLLAQLKQLYKQRYEQISLPVQTVNDQVFVAMWFDGSMKQIWSDGYVPAIEKCGYKAVRIDEQQYDGSIIEQIMKEMSHSKAIIADLSGNRGGVYYEAGIARGLQLCKHPIRLILTCKTDCFDGGNGVHFDVRGYNCIVYNDVEDLKQKVLKRLQES